MSTVTLPPVKKFCPKRDSDLSRLQCLQDPNHPHEIGPAWAVDDSKMQLLADRRVLKEFGFPVEEVKQISTFSDAFSKITTPSEPPELPPGIWILDCHIDPPLNASPEQEEAEKTLLAKCKTELIQKGKLTEQDAAQLPEGPVLAALLNDTSPEVPVMLTSDAEEKERQLFSDFTKSKGNVKFIPKNALSPDSIRKALDELRAVKQRASSTSSQSAPSTPKGQNTSPFHLPAQEPKPDIDETSSQSSTRTSCCNKVSNFFKALWQSPVPPPSPKTAKTA